MKLPKNLFMYIFAYLVILLLFVFVGILLFKPIILDNKEIIYTSFGLLLGWGTSIVGYYFGSSKSSADKTDILNSSGNSTNINL